MVMRRNSGKREQAKRNKRRANLLQRLFRIEALEARQLLTGSGLGDDGCVDHFELSELIPYEPLAVAVQASPTNVERYPLSDTFLLHSLPGATKTIYLDFDGHVTTGTPWNSSTGIDPMVTPAYDFDGNPGSFSNAELQRIQDIFDLVSEDFRPFDVNVTTEDPGVEALRNTGGSDNAWGIRVVFGPDQMSTGAGGIAYIGSFDASIDIPTFVYNVGFKGAAEAASHEVGHTLGLRHDGTPALNYYGGHGTGPTGWGPIMGASYGVDLVQWSVGEYPTANNQEDDLNIIVTQNGFGYRADDHGNSTATSTPATVTNNTDLFAEGIIETTTDVDMFEFITGTGQVTIDIEPYYFSPNLDILATLYDASGTVVATSNPVDELVASFDLPLLAGTYYISVEGTGRAGSGTDFGYSDYASLGYFSMAGTIADPGIVVPGPELFAVRPDDRELLSRSAANLLHEAPRELRLLFKGGANLDAATLGNGIRVTRSNGDDQSAAPFQAVGTTTFDGTSGATVTLTANSTDDRGLQVVFVNNPSGPSVQVVGSTITIGLSSTTTAGEVVDAINNHLLASGLITATTSAADRPKLVGNPAAIPAVALVDNDIVITPGFIGLGETDNEVILRFAERLPDDLYQVEVFGIDDSSLGVVAVRSQNGLPLTPFVAGTNRDVFRFELDLGAQVLAVVPQPITRLANGTLSQAQNQVVVYFDDDMHATTVPLATGDLAQDPPVVDVNFYQLILGRDTVRNTDDAVFNPTSVVYDPDARTATLTFANNLTDLVDPLTMNPVGASTFRLRVGDRTPLPAAPLNLGTVLDPGSNYAGARDLTANLMQPVTTGIPRAIVVSQSIQNFGSTDPSYPLDSPGAENEPGHREIQAEDHLLPGANGVDSTPGITTRFYNFDKSAPYGVNLAGQPLYNNINEAQMQRAREIFEYYGNQLGVQFVESESSGIWVITGEFDASIIQQFEPSGPGGVAGVGGGNRLVMDIGETWDNGFNGNWMDVAFHEIGHTLNLGHSYDLTPGTIMGAEGALSFGQAAEPIFPGEHDVTHGRMIYRPESKDIDLYQFTVPNGAPGHFTAEVIAERRMHSSSLDSFLRLYRQNADGSRTLLAQNDDYFGEDSFVEMRLEPGTYFVGVSASGNDKYDPAVRDSGYGGVTEGAYDLKLNFVPDPVATFTDVDGVALDGDADGVPGGTFNFWFRTAPQLIAAPTNNAETIFVDKSHTTTASNPGTIGNPYRNISDALAIAGRQDIVRVIANGGADGQVETLADNLAYEIGHGGPVDQPLQDGLMLEVPRDITLVFDAGAVFKLRDARIGVGSTPTSIDRSGGALQVLGTPDHPVIFTSYHDESIGVDTNTLDTTPTPGEWGGLEFRSDVDGAEGRRMHEKNGVFLNIVNFADIRYGGGQVTIDSDPRVINPIQMIDTRVTATYNRITLSSDAAISATPNAFLETTFNEPPLQISGAFTSDYTRIGPQIRGNTVVDNSSNALFIRIDTPAGGTLQPLSVSGRWDDTDIVHMLAENLNIQGTPSGAKRESTPPAVNLVTRTAQTVSGGTLAAGNSYSYRVAMVDPNGYEGQSSATVAALTLAGAQNGILLNRLPTANGEFVSRRLYRSTNGGTFQLVAELNADDVTYLDTGATLGGAISGLGVINRPRPDARLAIDPGVVVKLLGAKIEAEIGAQLIAEGTAAAPIIFTSLNNDQHGAGGSFDTDGGRGGMPLAGNWAGIYGGGFSTISLDHTLISYAGGETDLGGVPASFNAVETHQGKLRITNSVLEFNDAGTSGGGGNRDGHLSNGPAVIFVRGSQPILVNNVIRNNDNGGANTLAVVSINANAMNADLVLDYGRSRGELAAFGQYVSNQGPLIRQNKLGGNEINGLQVRGGTLSTDSVWDDTDIVHVVVNDQIYVPDLHTFGGLRLESKPNESLVVKLSGDAGFVSTGRPLDIDDRIGGMLHVVGTPGFPVIFTSLADDTAGAGFDPQGLPQMDTNGNGASVGAAGDWNGLLIDQYSHDRNVDIITELESPQAVAPGPNATAGSAQALGTLATSEKTGDESLRLGFTVEGVINSPNDLDVYQFFAKGGTEVWIDIDRTSHALDTVVELIDVNGNILAQSDDSFTETSGATNLFVDINTYPLTNRVNVLQKSDYYEQHVVSGTPKDHFSTNIRDAGMRVVLHSASTTTNKYFVRVRSSNIDRTAGGNPADLQDLSKVNDGLTAGSYQLNIRLRETDEFPGSTIRYADVRYADTGIEVRGMPLHSPLGGEATEISGNNDSPGAGQDLGNLLSADRATLGVAGQSSGSGDIDFYQFDVLFDSIQQGPNGPPVSTVFDIDYADGFGRPDLILSVFDGNGRLVLMGNDSNVADDQGGPNLGTDSKDLSRGSGGLLDPYIGSALLPTGSYSVAVSTAAQIPAQAQQYQLHNPANTNVRLEPVTSVERLAEDRIGTSGGSGVFGADTLPLLFDAPGSTTSPANAIDWHLGDVALYITSGSNLTVLDPFTGAVVGSFTSNNTGNSAHSDLAMRQDGKLFSFSTPSGTRNDGNSGNFLQFNLGTGAATSIGDDGIATFQDDTNPANLPNDIAANVGYQFEALAFRPDGSDNRLFAIGNRFGNANNVGYTRNVLYRFNQNTGASVNAFGGDRGNPNRNLGAGTQRIEVGQITVGGNPLASTITGMSFIGNQLFAVDSVGNVYSVNEGNATASLIATLSRDDFDSTAPNVPVSFSGLTTGPRFVEGSTYANMLFATDSSGRLYAFNTAGTPQAVFVDGQSVIDTGRNSAEGLAFSTLDVNLWHVNSETTADTVNAMAGHSGSSSLYFGFQTVGTTPGQWDNTVYNPRGSNNFATNDANITRTYDFPGGAHGVIESNTFDLSGYNAADKPVLYFNYYLDTEKQDGGDMRDAFRVYIANEDGDWSLIATNNNGGGEFVADDGSNGQILFDVGDTGTRAGDNTGPAPNVWRQARILLDAYAGQSDLRLRFEFDSSGNSLVGDGASTGDELRMIDGNKLRDGQTFIILDTDGTPVTFEFDLGYTLVAPTGKDLVDGNSFTLNATSYTFRNSPTLATDIQIDPSDSANEVMDKIRARLNATGFFTASGLRDGHRLNIPTVAAASATGLPATFIEGAPGISGLSDVELDVTAAMPAWDSNANFGDDIKSVVRVGVAEQFNVTGRKPSDIGNAAATSLIKHAREIVRIIGRDSSGNARSVANAGPLGLTDRLSGDTFSTNMVNENAGGGSNNFQGVYVDDIIIGFAERGEVVTGAANDATSFNPNLQVLQTPISTTVGNYQLEIRRGAAFNNEASMPPMFRSFNTNDRLSEQHSLVAPAGNDIYDGQTFTLSDGVESVTFEYEDLAVGDGVAQGNFPVNFRVTDADDQVAESIRNAINSPTIQGILNLRADLSDGTEAGPTSTSNIVNIYGNLVGNVAGNLLPGNFAGFGEVDQTNPNAVVRFGDDTTGQYDLGDQNLHREQGQVLIFGNVVRDSAGYGIAIDAGLRQGTVSGNIAPLSSDQQPHQGPVRNLRDINTSRLLPGVVVTNNLVMGSGTGGILFSGDAVAGQAPPVPYGRVVNNTVYGNRQGDIGINVTENAGPTLLNNIVANLSTGIRVDGSSAANTVLASNLYQNNTQNVAGASVGLFGLVLNTSDPLFVDPANRNFYLAPGSAAIDSAQATFGDRTAFISLKDSAGLPASPLLAPSVDVFGQLRVDGNGGTGQGGNVRVDRGAMDRADFKQPVALLDNPIDNDLVGVDLDPNPTVVQLSTNLLDSFSINLTDPNGTGIDATTINDLSVTVTQDGRLLEEGVDFTLGYNINDQQLLFTPLSQIWEPGHVYVITLNNRDQYVIEAPNGLQVSDGDQFTIEDQTGGIQTYEFESGYTLTVPKTLTLQVPEVGGVAVVSDMQTFTIDDGSPTGPVVFELDSNNNWSSTAIRVPFGPTDNADNIVSAIITAIDRADGQVDGNFGLGLAPRALGSGQLHLGSTVGHVVDVTNSTLQIDGVADGIDDGETIFVTDGVTRITFEFDSTGALNDPANHVALSFLRTDTYEEIADKLTTALRNANVGLDTTQHLGDGVVQVGGGKNHRIDTSNSSVSQVGSPGVAESLRLHVPALSVSLTIPNGGAVTVPDNAKFALGDGVSPPIVFELDDNASGLSPGSDVVVSIVGNETRTELANVVANAIRIQFPSLNVTVGPSGQISLGNSQGYVVDTSQAGGITSTSIANVADMESFSIQVAGSAPVVFEFNNNGGSVTGGRLAINIPTNATVSQVVSAMQSVIGGVASLGLAPSIEPYGVLALNETTMYTADTSATSVFDTGVPGGAVAIPVQPSLSYTSQFVAGLLIEAINTNQPALDARFRGGGTIYLDGAVAIQGITAFAVDAVQDLAGNQLQSNQPTGETQFTIILGDVPLDYGDAPNTYHTLLANNGARHAQVVGNALRLGSRIDTESNGQPNAMADGDDGDQFISLGTSGFSLNTSTVSQQSPFTLRVPDGSLALEGTTLVLTSALGSVTFEFNSNGSTANGVPIAIGDLRPEYYGANDVVDNLVAAIKAQVALNNLPSNTIAKNLNSGVLYLEGLTSVDVPAAVPALSPLVMLNRLPASISVVDGATLVDQQQFTISDGVNPPLVFEFENTTVGNGLTDLAFWEVSFAPGDTATTVAANVASAVTAAVASGRLSGVTVVNSLDGRLQISTASGQEEDDDDGVIFHQPFNPGSQRTQITVEVTDIGLLDAWVDFNQNGIFEDSERIFASVPLVAGANQLFAATPAGALTGQTYARFRVNSSEVLTPYGLATGGEVEDYLVDVIPGSPPVVTDAVYSVLEDQDLNIAAVNGVLVNNVMDPDLGDAGFLKVRLFRGPLNAEHFVFNEDGSFEYRGADDFNGDDTFLFEATDPRLASDTVGTVTIHVRSQNDAPIAETVVGSLTGTISEDSVVPLILGGSDVLAIAFPGNVTATDETRQTLTLGLPGFTAGTSASIASAQGGTVTYEPGTNEFRYTPGAHYNSKWPGIPTDTFTYTITDDGNSHDISGAVYSDPLVTTGTVTITVVEINDAPIARTETISTDINGNTILEGLNAPTPVTISVSALLANDAPGPDGTMPNRAVDEVDGASKQTLTVVINGTQSTTQGGTVRLQGSTVIYTPPLHFSGSDTFNYQIRDNGTNNALPSPLTAGTFATINVVATNNSPVAGADSISGSTVREDETQTIAFTTVLANDNPGPMETGQSLTVSLVGGAASVGSTAGGTVTIVGSTFRYVPPLNYNKRDGVDTFQYVITDNGQTNGVDDFKSVTGVVSVTLEEVNDPPILTAETLTGYFEDPASPITIGTGVLLSNDQPGPANESTQSKSVTSVSAVTAGGGLLALNETNVVYTPAANFNGLFVFDYTVRDNGSTAGVVDTRSATIRSTISITAVNDAPVPGGDTVIGVNEDVDNFPISIVPLLSNDAPGPATATDEASPNQTVSFVGLVNGAVVGNNGVSTNGGVVTTDGNVIFYSPADDFFGTDYIPYVITDNGVPAMTATGTITVTVAAVNDPPVANDDQKPGAEDTPLSFLASDLTVNDLKGPANESAQTLTVIGFGLASSPSLNTVTSRGGSATLNTQTGQIQYTPAPNVSGNDTFIYVVEDSGTAAGGGTDKLRATATVTISVAERNDTPEPMDDLATVGEDPVGDLTITFASLLLNDSAGPGESPTSMPPQNLFVSGPTTTFTSAAGGTVMVDTANSRFSYHPPVDFFGADHFVYSVTDDGTTFGSPDPKSNSATVFINVTQANDPPVPTNDHFHTPEESTASITAVQLTGNDLAGPLNESQGVAAQTLTLLGPETLAANANNQTTQGALISINGGVVEVDYSGLVNFVGVDTFFYVIEDNGTTNGTLAPLRATGVATVTVTAVNDAPIVSDDDLRATLSSTEALEDSDITIAASLVLANDVAGPSTAADELNGSQTVTLVDVEALSGQGGSVQLLGGSIVYHGPVDFVGEDIITYVIEDDGTTDGVPDPLRATGQITISVHPVNDPPVAGDDVVTATEDEPIVFSTLLANDMPGPATAIDEQSPAQTLSIVGVTMLAPGGTIQVVNGTEVQFTPAADFNGFTSFRYTVQDNGSPARVATATVSVQVLAKNDPPIPGTDNRSTPENQPLVISETSLLANDLKGPADESNQSLTIPATAGAVAVLPADVSKISVSRSAGSITVTPIGEFNGEARFTYVVQDNGTPSLSATGTVVVTVTPVNDPPVPVDDHFTTDEDTQLSFNVSALLAGTAGSNDVPGPANESSQNLIVRSVTGPSAAGGSVVFNNQTGAVNYTPALNFAGVDTFTYVVEDDGFSGPNPDPRSATGTITVTVNPINDAPSFTKGSDQTVNEDAGAQTVPGWASNIAAGPLTATDELQNQQVGFQISTSDDALFSMLPSVDANGQLTYTTAPNANGAASVTVRAVDSELGMSAPQTFTITVRPLNDPPSFALLGNVTVAEESGPYQADGFASAILPGPLGAVDELGQLVTFTVTNNNNGLFSAQPAIDAAGRLTFTPAADAFGEAVVTVVGRDNGSNEAPNSNTAAPRTFTISITEQNDPPVAVDDHYSADENSVLVVAGNGLLDNDTDSDSPVSSLTMDTFDSVSILGVPVSVNSDGTFTYDPTGVAVIQQLTTGQTLVDTFTYTATDGLSASAPGTVSLTITGSNDPPEAKNDAVLVRVNTATNLNVLSNDSDVDGTINISSVTIVTGPTNGTASVNANGTILYTPGANFNGVDTLTYTVKDQQGATSNVANVTINVNHFPVAVDDAFVVPIDAVNHKLSILANDSDQDGSLDPSSITIQVFPTNGSLVFNSSDPTAVFYTPNSGFTGTDSFTYTVADNLGAVSNVANVRITVSNSPHRNPTNPFDVNADGVVSPIDALILINEINRNGSRALPIPPVAPDVPPPYLDPTGDNTLSPNDVGVIITELNRVAATQSAEGEAAGEIGVNSSLASDSLVAASMASESATADATLSPSLLSAPEQTVRQTPSDLHSRLVDHLLASSPRTLPVTGLNTAAGQDDFDSILDEITTEVDRKRRSLASDVALEDLLWGDDRRTS